MDQRTFNEAVKAEGVTGDFERLARSIFQQESGGGKNTKTSNAGAVGGMQIIPATFASVAEKGWDINNPLDNARAGIRYLAQMHKASGGDPSLTAVGYYGGPGAITKAKRGIAVSDPRNPKAPNTFQYAQQVVGRMGGSGESNPMQAFTPVNKPAPMEAFQSAVPAELQPIQMGSVTGPVAMNDIPTQTQSYQDRVNQEMEAFIKLGSRANVSDAMMAAAQDQQQPISMQEAPVSMGNQNQPKGNFNYVLPQAQLAQVQPLQPMQGFGSFGSFGSWGR